jgi:large subunit ribosomal protein L35
MPKLKTNRSVKKRMRITKKGKVRIYGAGKSHLLTGKSAKRKRFLSKPRYVSKAQSGTMKRLLPYGA